MTSLRHPDGLEVALDFYFHFTKEKTQSRKSHLSKFPLRSNTSTRAAFQKGRFFSEEGISFPLQSRDHMWFLFLFFFVCVCVYVCVFLELHLWHMEVPRLGGESEL